MTTDPTTPTVVATTDDLAALAARIDEEHGRCEAAFKASVQHAITAGQLLLEAKAQLPHGAWLPWLRDHCAVPERSAQLYMKLARELPARLEADKSATVADLTMRQAVALLAPAAPVTTPWPFLAWPLHERQEHCRRWWDLQAQYTILLDAEGLTAARIAAALGIKIDEVRRVFHPQPSVRFGDFCNGGTNQAGECFFVGDVKSVYTALVR